MSQHAQLKNQGKWKIRKIERHPSGLKVNSIERNRRTIADFTNAFCGGKIILLFYCSIIIALKSLIDWHWLIFSASIFKARMPFFSIKIAGSSILKLYFRLNSSACKNSSGFSRVSRKTFHSFRIPKFECVIAQRLQE